MIPENLTQEDILKAIKEIDEKGIPCISEVKELLRNKDEHAI